MLVDRHEDLTDPNQVEDDPNCNREIVFYGYVRGTHLKHGMKVHLIGIGDYSMTEVNALPDPCPIPEKERERTVSPFPQGQNVVDVSSKLTTDISVHRH